ncbi:sn-glycerol-3-phosphate ABC transporter ATP-binding protein UgpC [Paucibacter sp. B2R-40]|uniref:ABC transporter ATP-binding protein n=1 Tax=Paucibacter sp. B2R-40 TaxID=2893554 RepID=UPI0021E4740A|nr:sn-glycerol-3-phosphate ABC transporter ATP-binding protein UgpC [Paucibacter sp. B2R-40]MCV2356350.1 sn-glycerol-3-phosphate ABC transporter ATP-binding protein UgpC [Paucibacter sp. B2R-40]
MADLSLRGLRKSYGSVDVLKGIDLEIADREFVCFLGPSGCGKSTLLRCIAGLEPVQSGELMIGGERMNEVPPAERDLAMVFQNYALYPHMTVRKNLSFGLSLRRFSKAEIDTRIAEAARMLQLEALLERKPKALSGGQRQRVAIGRAIVRNPRVFLFDEPLSNLDAALRENTRMELARLHQALQATMIYVTHDQVEAMTLADKVVVLNQGRIAQVGRPLELYHRPADLFVAGFIGTPRMNFLSVELQAMVDGLLQLRLPACATIASLAEGDLAPLGAALTLGVRPEHIRLLAGADRAAHLQGKVLAVERLGAQSMVHVSAGLDQNLTVCVDGAQLVQRGDAVGLQFELEHMHVFAADGRALPRRLSAAVQEALAQ